MWSGLAFVLQGQHQDAFEATHVDQVEAQSSRAGGIEPLGAVALGQAQQLLPLPQLGPGERCIEQPLGKLAHVGPQRHGLADQPIG